VLGKNQRLTAGSQLPGEQASGAPLRVGMYAVVERVGRLLAQQREAQTKDSLQIGWPRASGGERPSGVYADSPPM
jgi:hypothetical protein